MLEYGFSESAIQIMTAKNPARILSLEEI